jgi:hypothetical protein
MPMVLSAFQIAGSRINRNALAIAPVAFRNIHVIPERPQSIERRVRKAWLYGKHVW